MQPEDGGGELGRRSAEPVAVNCQARNVASASRVIRRLLEAGAGVEGIRMLKRMAERDIRRSAATGEEAALAEEALRLLYQRKAFGEKTGTDEEHYPERRPPPPPPPPHGPRHRPDRRPGPGHRPGPP